jgi:tetratricopeptide (TPR) repeat protein
MSAPARAFSIDYPAGETNKNNEKGEQRHTMQNPVDQPRNLTGQRRRTMASSCLVLIFVLIFLCTNLWAAPEKEKPAKKPVPAQTPGAAPGPTIKPSAINDSNINAVLKRADEMMKKGEVDGPLKILLGVYEYSKDILFTVKFFQGYYEKLVNDSNTPQGEKEELYIKLKRMGQLVPKYNNIKEVTTYNIGYLYAKKGEAEKARKYLIEVLELTPFSTKKDSISMKAKTLLLDLYDLEGEF